MARRPFTPAERTGHTLRQMADGTLGGRSRVAAPIRSGASWSSVLGTSSVGGQGAGVDPEPDGVTLERITVYSTDAQSIATGTATAVEWDAAAARPSEQDGFDDYVAGDDHLDIPFDGELLLSIRLTWDTYDGGGTVAVEVTSSDGINTHTFGGITDTGRQFADTAHLRVREGDVVKVKVTQSSGSAQNLASAEAFATLIDWPLFETPILPPADAWLWIDASRISGVADGDPLSTSTLLDYSGNDNDPVTVSSVTYRSGIGKNSMPAIEFNTGSDYVSFGGATDPAWKPMYDGSGLTVFGVFERNGGSDSGSPDDYLFEQSVVGSGSGSQLALDLSGGDASNIRFVVRYNLSSTNVQTTGAAFVDTEQHLFTVVYDEADTPDCTIYVDGTPNATGDLTHGQSASPDGGFFLGANPSSSVGSARGYWREFIVYFRRLTAEEIADTHTYLTGKWGTD